MHLARFVQRGTDNHVYCFVFLSLVIGLLVLLYRWEPAKTGKLGLTTRVTATIPTTKKKTRILSCGGYLHTFEIIMYCEYNQIKKKKPQITFNIYKLFNRIDRRRFSVMDERFIYSNVMLTKHWIGVPIYLSFRL